MVSLGVNWADVSYFIWTNITGRILVLHLPIANDWLWLDRQTSADPTGVADYRIPQILA
jgi:hypothetical protein